MGDIFIPVRALGLNRCYIVASPANLGIPVIGPLLPMLGALPLPDSITGMKKLNEAIRSRIAEHKCVVFYPEDSLPKKQRKEQLRNTIYDCMLMRLPF